jgi:hypothetical protein
MNFFASEGVRKAFDIDFECVVEMMLDLRFVREIGRLRPSVSSGRSGFSSLNFIPEHHSFCSTSILDSFVLEPLSESGHLISAHVHVRFAYNVVTTVQCSGAVILGSVKTDMEIFVNT